MAQRVSIKNPNINSGNSVYLAGGDLTLSWKNMINADVRNNGFGIVETQNSGWENPTYNLRFYIPIINTGSLATSDWCTWSQWISFAKNRYDGTSSTLNTLTVLLATSTPLMSYALNTTTLGTSTIPFTIKSFSLRANADESLNGKVITIDAQLIEDKYV